MIACQERGSCMNRNKSKGKRKADKRTWFVRIVALIIVLLMVGSVFAVLLSAGAAQ